MSHAISHDPAPEFSRPVAVERLPAAGTDYQLTASPEERAALAARFGVAELRALTAEIRLKPVAGGPIVRMTGTLSAELVQNCVVTLVPLVNTVTESFERTFGPAVEEDAGELELFMDDEDPADAIVDGHIDLGEVVAEELALAMDPFPRAAGAEFHAPEEPAAPEEKKPSPFAVLATLKQKKA